MDHLSRAPALLLLSGCLGLPGNAAGASHTAAGQDARLTVQVAASPAVATERLRDVLKTYDVDLTVQLRPKGAVPLRGPSCNCGTLKMPAEGPMEVTFENLRQRQAYEIAVQVPKYVVPEWREVLLVDRVQRERVTIPFRVFSVDAQPGFRLYVADPPRLKKTRGVNRDPRYFIARSGSLPPGKGFVLGATDRSVDFFFWNIGVIQAVLAKADESETAPIEIVRGKAMKSGGYSIPDYLRRGFHSIRFQALPMAGAAQ